MFKFDGVILFLVIVLSVLGILNFFSASYYYSLKNFDNSYFYFLKFLTRTTILGFLLFFLGNFLAKKIENYRKLFILLFALFYCSLFLVFLPNFKLPGSSASRWVNFDFISFQPSEIIKPLSILFLAFLFLHFKKTDILKKLFLFIIFLFMLLTPIYLQPSLSNVIIIFTSLTTSFLTFLKTKKEIFTTLLVSFLIFLILVVFSMFWSYRFERLVSFFTKGKLYEERHFQLEISQIGIALGGLFGKGLGKSEMKIAGVPQLLTDSIFVVFAEELGFVGSVILILLFLTLILMIILKGIKTKSEIKKPFAFGVGVWLFLQTFLHLGSNIGLIVPTGVVLPFFSYGPSAQLPIYFSLGIISRDE